jgi:hypothetical protein
MVDSLLDAKFEGGLFFSVLRKEATSLQKKGFKTDEFLKVPNLSKLTGHTCGVLNISHPYLRIIAGQLSMASHVHQT